ncbi:MAG TPA: hypothetical protein VIQ23_10585 [Hanamia sp.]
MGEFLKCKINNKNLELQVFLKKSNNLFPAYRQAFILKTYVRAFFILRIFAIKIPHPRAYDIGYISINEKFEILLSSELKKKNKEDFHSKYFARLNRAKIILPKKILP